MEKTHCKFIRHRLEPQPFFQIEHAKEDAPVSDKVFQESGAGKIGVAVEQDPEPSAVRLVLHKGRDSSATAPVHEPSVGCGSPRPRIRHRFVRFAAPLCKCLRRKTLQNRMPGILHKNISCPPLFQILFHRRVRFLCKDQERGPGPDLLLQTNFSSFSQKRFIQRKRTHHDRFRFHRKVAGERNAQLLQQYRKGGPFF